MIIFIWFILKDNNFLSPTFLIDPLIKNYYVY